jgi:hypothetical protein
MPSNPYYQNTFSGQPGQTARAEAVSTETGGIQAGFDGVEADVARSFKGQPGETLNALPAAVSRQNKWMRFDASGQPTIVNAPFNYRGNWAPSTLYLVGDAYNAAPNGSLYYVQTQYTSGSSFGSTDTTNATKIVDLTGLYFSKYSSVTTGPATITAVDGGSYAVDSTLGNITIDLPNETAMGQSPINVTVVGGSLSGSQLVTIHAYSGQYIMGSSTTDVNIDVANSSVSMFWAGATYGWRLRTMG